MLSFLVNFISGFLGLLSSFLPNDPLADWIEQDLTALANGLGYLNWIFPVGECVIVFTAYLGLLAAWAAVSLAARKASSISEKLA